MSRHARLKAVKCDYSILASPSVAKIIAISRAGMGKTQLLYIPESSERIIFARGSHWLELAHFFCAITTSALLIGSGTRGLVFASVLPREVEDDLIKEITAHQKRVD